MGIKEERKDQVHFGLIPANERVILIVTNIYRMFII